MKKLARIFGFGEERRNADAVRSKRQSTAIAESRATRRRPEMMRENLQTTFTKQRDSKQQANQEASNRHFLITNSNHDLVGVVGMGGATKKLKNAMQARLANPDVPRATESGVFVTSPRAIDVMPLSSHDVSGTIDTRAIEEVTLIVYGWENVQPGTLSWVFPSLRSALAAVRAMRNAVRWAVLNGAAEDDDAEDVQSARDSGRVLVEAS